MSDNSISQIIWGNSADFFTSRYGSRQGDQQAVSAFSNTFSSTQNNPALGTSVAPFAAGNTSFVSNNSDFFAQSLLNGAQNPSLSSSAGGAGSGLFDGTSPNSAAQYANSELSQNGFSSANSSSGFGALQNNQQPISSQGNTANPKQNINNTNQGGQNSAGTNRIGDDTQFNNTGKMTDNSSTQNPHTTEKSTSNRKSKSHQANSHKNESNNTNKKRENNSRVDGDIHSTEKNSNKNQNATENPSYKNSKSDTGKPNAQSDNQNKGAGAKGEPTNANRAAANSRFSGSSQSSPNANPTNGNPNSNSGSSASAKAAGDNFMQSAKSQAQQPNFVRGVMAMTNTSGGSMTMKLNPESLGALRIQMTMHQGDISLQFHANSEEAGSMIRESLDGLRSTLAAQGFKLDQVTIHSLNRGQGSPSGQHYQQDGNASGQNHDAGGERSRGFREQGAGNHRQTRENPSQQINKNSFSIKYEDDIT